MSVISVLAFLVLYHYAGVNSFWLDELVNVGTIRSELSFSDCMNIYKHQEANAPLYFIFSFFWYRLVPHTEQALLSLSIIFTLLAAIVTGLIGEKLSGIRVGILSFLFLLCNRQHLAFAAHEFRPYSFLTFVAAVNIYFYLSRLQNESWRNIILYGVTMCLLPYTHYVSVLLCFGLFIADCVLIARKHAGLKVIASYIIGALLFLPWCILFMLPRMGSFSSYWAAVPAFSNLLETARWFTSSQSFFDLPLIIAAAGTIYVFSNSRLRENKFLCSGIFASAFMILVSFIYSRYINPSGSFFVNRYFFSITPFVSLVMASGTDYLYTKLKPAFGNKNFLIFAIILFAFCFVNLFYIRHSTVGNVQPYREVADIIYQNEQSFKGKSAIIATTGSIPRKGWEEMYLTKDHTREVPVIFYAGDKEALEQIKSANYDRIYLTYLHAKLESLKNQDIINWLKENYSFSEKIEDYNFQILERMK